MDIKKKRDELIILLIEFLNGDLSARKLQSFVWEVIDSCTSNKENLLPEENAEKAFWYAIWEIQHLADDDHLTDGHGVQELMEALDFLKEKKQIPSEYIGRRP